ncbi:MAG: hypothetical protein WBQ25_14905, partial [Nitrososphaeraceae archaeon]
HYRHYLVTTNAITSVTTTAITSVTTTAITSVTTTAITSSPLPPLPPSPLPPLPCPKLIGTRSEIDPIKMITNPIYDRIESTEVLLGFEKAIR